MSLERNLSRLTVSSYAIDLRQFEAFLTGDGRETLDVGSVTTNDVRAWLVERSEHGDGPRTLRRKVQAVRAFYKWLMRSGEVDANPAVNIEMAKMPKRLPDYVREQAMDRLLDEEADMNDFETVRNRLVVMMLYETGIRRAELIGLVDRNVDTHHCEMKVHGKRDKDRIVPFGDELRRWIETYRQLRNSQCGSTEAFFVRETGEPLYPSLVYRIVKHALQRVGGSAKQSPHVLRHTFASSMLNGGAELNSVKELLGHESLAATQIYTHVTFSELKNNYKLAHPRALKKEDNHEH